MINDFKLSDNFHLTEFECTHSKHRHVQVDSKLVEKLEKLREKLGNKRILINSAYRCKERNKQVGGALNSQHLKGKAVDISLRNQDLDIEDIAKLAKEVGFKGIGLYNTFIHVDVRDSNSVVIWDNRK
ncbi:MAG: YcbK family protein [Nanoarchaeota archaeon]